MSGLQDIVKMLASGGGGSAKSIPPEIAAALLQKLQGPEVPADNRMASPYGSGSEYAPVGAVQIDSEAMEPRGYSTAPNMNAGFAMQSQAYDDALADTNEFSTAPAYSDGAQPFSGVPAFPTPSRRPAPEMPNNVVPQNFDGGGAYRAPSGPDEPFDPNMMPGMGEDPRGMFGQEDAFNIPQPQGNSFIPGAEYQTADLAGLKDPGFTPLEETKTSDLAKMEMGARNAMDRLSQIDDMLNRNPDAFDDLTFQGQMKLSGARWKDYFNMDLSPEQESYLTNATQTRAAVMENMNYTIKEMTGAQMGVQEAERIMATMPGPNDTPTEFKAKLARARESTMLAVARYNYWRNKGGGGTPQDIGSIPDMNKILQQRGAELFNEMRQSGLSNSDARLQAARALSQEFGL